MSPKEWKSCAKSFTRLFPSTQPLVFLLLFSISPLSLSPSFSPSVSSRVLSSVPAASASTCPPTDFHANSLLLSPPFFVHFSSKRREKRRRNRPKRERTARSRARFLQLHEVIFEIPRRPRDSWSLAFFPFSRPFYFCLRPRSSYPGFAPSCIPLVLIFFFEGRFTRWNSSLVREGGLRQEPPSFSPAAALRHKEKKANRNLGSQCLRGRRGKRRHDALL